MASDDLPRRWHEIWNGMDGDEDIVEPGPNLQEWLEEVYFGDTKEHDLTAEDIARLGQIIARLLRFEPNARVSAREVLDDAWFHE